MTDLINLPVYSDALVVLGTAGVVVPLVRYFGLNPVLGYLAAGVLLGPDGLGSFIDRFPALYWVTVVDAKNVKGVADLGVVFLLFLIGLELSLDRLLSMRRLVFGLGGLQFVFTAAALSALIAAAGAEGSAAIILGASLALSSTAIVLEILSAQGALTTGAGRASFSILLAQDLAVIPILMFVTVIGAHGQGSLASHLLDAAVHAGEAVIVILLVGRVVIRPLFRVVGAVKSPELLVAAVLFIIIGTGVIAAVAGLSMALGAFIAGLLLAETEYRKAVESIVDPFKGLLLGVFFFTIGMGLDVRDVLREPLLILAAVSGLILFKAAIIVPLVRLFGFPWRVATETGLLLGPGGEFAFVAIGMSATMGLVSARLSSFAEVVTSLTMFLIPALAAAARAINERFGSPHHETSALGAAPAPQRRHAIVIGHGRIGAVVTAFLRKHEVPHIATDNDPDAVIADRERGYDVYFGDARLPPFLRACGVMEASVVIVTVGSRSIADAIVQSVRDMRPDVRIVARARDTAHAKRLYAIGVTDAVPETIEASLQLSEAALTELGFPVGLVDASVHERRDRFREELMLAAKEASGASGRRPLSSSRSPSPSASVTRENAPSASRTTDLILLSTAICGATMLGITAVAVTFLARP